MSQNDEVVDSKFMRDGRLYVNERLLREPGVRLSRSPHPYFHRGDTLQKADPNCSSLSAGEWSDVVTQTDAAGYAPSRKGSASPEESGTEGEDPGLNHVKALPAPVFRPRKGLRDTFDPSVSIGETPLVTPSGSQRATEKTEDGYFQISSSSDRQDSEQKARENNARRKRSEMLRRSCETLLLGIIALVVLQGSWVFSQELSTLRVSCIFAPLIIYSSLFAIYVLTTLLGLRSFSKCGFKITSFNIPTTFDPAPLIYPTILPILVASSLSSPTAVANFDTLATNAILSLSAIPDQLIPKAGTIEAFNSVHWLITLIPVFVYSYLNDGSIISDSAYPELLYILFPLHRTLVSPLHYLTTSSLLPSELQLLSIALINVLVLSKSPQFLIMRSIIWMGGFGLFVFCYKPLQWNVVLERMPNVRMPRYSRTALVSQTSFESLGSRNRSTPNGVQPQNEKASAIHKRRQTVIGIVHQPPSTLEPTGPQPKHKPARSSSIEEYIRMPPWKLELKKWGYALYTYLVTAGLVLFPIRQYISSRALSGQDPFLWAIGYLFSGLPGIRSLFEAAFHIPLAPLTLATPVHSNEGFIEYLRVSVIGASNSRLLLFGYWAAVLALGIFTVLHLSAFVEVDTRRKVFHGMMVLMLLPTAYIDPLFLSLGLILVLAVFLLLDLFRASQLRPVSRPLAQFLTPYVDGRDLRGPVVVSHIFLLIGCAIPFWLSLAGIQRTTLPSMPEWRDWETATRDTSMVAGVICVGVGDAAASLVGRRFGRHKWPWRGGKSLEGSAAFAVAVTIGLLIAKAWLRFGGWAPTPLGQMQQMMVAMEHNRRMWWWEGILKAVLAASGASFTEAVLTGCNDNVVVPIVLWLLVRGCDSIALLPSVL